MSVVITEISVFLFFAALVGFVTGRFTRSRPREAGSAGEAQARRHLEGHRERASHGLRIHESRVGEAAWWESRRVPSMARVKR